MNRTISDTVRDTHTLDIRQGERTPKQSPLPGDSGPESTIVAAPRQTISGGWHYVLFGFVLFLLGAGMSIVTIIYKEDVAAAPLVMFSVSGVAQPIELQYGPQPLLNTPSFYAETRASFIVNKQTFIEANLSLMVVRYYEEGMAVFEAPILSKGKEGLWWETPTGLYEIKDKIDSHFSSFGNVYQPWSMVFQGNFFIHGWPHYLDGTPVSSQYSGGCIRLSNEDAEQLFSLTKIGTPVLIFEDNHPTDTYSYETPTPQIDAQAYLVADVTSGTVLIEKNPTTTAPIASIAKLMTALIAAEHTNFDKPLSITEAALATTAIPRLIPNTMINGYSLLLPLLLESSNEAAAVYSNFIGRSRFVTLMNSKAQSLGMTSSVFVDSSGVNRENISSAYDLFRFAQHLYSNRGFVLSVSSGRATNAAYEVYPFGALKNHNETTMLEGFVGGAVDSITYEDGTALVLYEINMGELSRTIAFIVLGSTDIHAAIQDLHGYITKRFAS